ncbi:transporter substrate-binding domain-containing protein [Pseudomonas fluorescens]|uniref:transporter substrate-binding domain-containing protein n=1 Tax=Pseudomonas fluorescens TaxID=294 RepID=UPI001BE6D2D9|nr:transporter substrate-binding domain-containing protein [Pseudomonas fluorescens]MBT2375390.1 transporter substrate-binding domain-containing protein [Pseudomonas fluorescens]
MRTLNVSFRWVGGLLILLCTAIVAAEPAAIPVNLVVNAPITAPSVKFDTQTETWLASNPEINVAIWSRALPPLDIGFDQSSFEGVTADYLGVIREATGLRLKIWRFQTHAQALEALEKGEIDMLALNELSEHSGGSITQTHPYLLNTKVIVRPIEETLPPSKDLKGQRLAYAGDKEVGKLLQQQYPQATLIQYSNHLNGLASLVYNQADAFWTDAITAEFLIRMLYSNDVYVSGNALSAVADINFAISDRKPQLLAAINQSLDAISIIDRMRITTRWGLSNDFLFNPPPLALDSDEVAWLSTHRKIRVLVAGSYAPMTFFDDQGRLQGLSADILKIIERRTGLELEIVHSNSVPAMLKELQSGRADLVAALTISDLRLPLEQYTRPYLISPFVVVTRRAGADIQSIEELRGKRLAITANNPLSNWLSEHYPEIIQIPVTTAVRGIELLSEHEVDASLHTQFGADYFIKHHFQKDLQIAAVIGPFPARVAMVVSPVDLPLKSIVDKVLLEIAPEELKTLSDRWRRHAAPAVSSSWNTYKEKVYKVVGVAIVFLLVFLIWNYYLQVQIKKRRSAELALNDQLSFSKALIDGSPIALYVRDRAGRLVHCNRAYSEFLQTRQEDVIGKTLVESGVISPDLSRHYEQVYRDAESHLEPVFADLEIDINGKKHRIYHWTFPFRSSIGVFSGIIGGWLDISEREHLMEQLRLAKEAAVEANNSKSIFLASMSHEIRTPISALIGLIEMVRVRGGSAHQIDENLKVAHQSAQSLLTLIGDILDLSKIEAGAMVPSPRPTHLGELLRSVHKLFEMNARNKNLKFDLLIDAVDEKVIIDSLMLNQIVANLISNAIKFTQHGLVQLSLKQLPDVESGFGSYLIEVRDSGIGLDDQQKTAIFEPFVQVTPDVNYGRSTGLGLSICTRLAALLEARLTVDSHPGIGSRFQMHFIAKRSQHVAAPETNSITTQMGPRLNILVVEDHAPNRLLLCQQIEYLGHRAVACHDGESALVEWQQAEPPFDLTITDCNMPHMDGFELSRRMRTIEQSKALRAHPIFGLTAHAQPHIVQNCLDAGMTQCLFKPIGIEALRQQIGAVSAQVERRSKAARAEGGELQKLKILVPDAYLDLVNELISTNRTDGTTLEELMRKNDFEKIVKLAHKIKGGAQIADAQELIDTCIELEAGAFRRDAAFCHKQIKALLTALQSLERKLLNDQDL